MLSLANQKTRNLLRLAILPALAVFCAFPELALASSALDRLPSERRAEFVQRYGEGADLVLEIDKSLDGLSRRELKGIDRSRIESALERLSKVDASKKSRAEKVQLAKAWRRASEFTIKMDGPSRKALAQLERAHELDPDDENLARMVRTERLRQRLALERVAEAKRVREARARGEDPYADEGTILVAPGIMESDLGKKGGQR